MNTPLEGSRENNIKERSRFALLLRWWWILSLAVLLLAAGIFIVKGKSLADKKASRQPSPTVPVTAIAAKTADVGVYLTGLGTVTALNTVTVKTRVDGQLMKVLFREGQLVRSGELLAQIDPRPFEVQLKQAEGQLVRDQALLDNARLDLRRYLVLSQQDSIAQQQKDTQESLVHQYEGNVKTDQGQIDNAKLQLIYCRIIAPVSGRVGLRLVDPGNIVHASDTNGLIVITQLQPITVIFPIAEDDLSKVLVKLRAGKKLAVEAYDRDQQNKLAAGTLFAVDNQIDTTTGTVRLKAAFPNKGNELFPNQFVNARLFVDTLLGVTVIPSEAIQRGPQGAFVYVVKADKTVNMRPINLGVVQEGEAVVKTGLASGELVVVEGADRLREGSKVEVKVQGGATQNNRRSPGEKKADNQ
jgi:membrane fusion protein, multidrug efflux system